MNSLKDLPLTNLELMLRTPSAFAEEPARGLSKNYGFVSTEKSVRILRRQGWQPLFAQEQRVHSARRIGFQRHMIRFRKAEFQKPILGDTWPEIVLVNSHDAMSAFVLQAGLWTDCPRQVFPGSSHPPRWISRGSDDCGLAKHCCSHASHS